MMQRIYVVCGAKGGTGATTLAFELADRLPFGGARVLVDGDLTGRRTHAVAFDVASVLDEHRAPGEPSVAQRRERTIVELARSYDDGFAVGEDAVEKLRRELPSDAVVVVDAPQPFASALRPFVARAARIVLVTEPTLFGIAAARSMLLAMKRFGIPGSDVTLVLNEGRAPRELSRAEIETALEHPIAAELPARRDRGWQRAVDLVVQDLPRQPGALNALLNQPGACAVGERRKTLRAVPPSSVALAPTGDDRTGFTDREHLKVEIHEKLLDRVDFQVAARAHTDAQKFAELRTQVDEIVGTLLAERSDTGTAEERARIRKEIVDEALGLGPIESLLHDDDVTEIMVNGFRNVYIERRGRIEKTPLRFANDRQVRLVIERIIAPLGRRVDEASPMVDARLPDGSRVNAIVAPLAIDGPTLTIRRFGTRRLSVEDLIALGSLTPPLSDFLRAIVQARLNVVVSGGTGSGKTTLLNAVSRFIPRDERVVTIEDAAELLLDQPHVVRLEARPPNIEGSGAVPVRELVRNALRMRPDRILVGECRAGEALDMLQAMNTGHDGSLTTVHANSARDSLSRIETMVLMAGFDLPVRAIREQVASAIDVVVHVARLRDGSRRVTSISEVIGMEGDVVTMQEIARFRQRGLDGKGVVLGEFEATGVQPNCIGRFEEMGIDFDMASLTTRTGGPVWALR